MLIGIAVEFPLTDLSVWIGFASFDIKGSSFCECVNMASFTGPITFGYWYYLKETALMLSGIAFNDTSISFILIFNTKCAINIGIDEGIFVVVLEYFEELIGGGGIVSDCKFVGFVLESEGFLVI